MPLFYRRGGGGGGGGFGINGAPFVSCGKLGLGDGVGGGAGGAGGGGGVGRVGFELAMVGGEVEFHESIDVFARFRGYIIKRQHR